MRRGLGSLIWGGWYHFSPGYTTNKIWRKTIFNMADGILTPCSVARSWHWFREVTAPCNVACGSGHSEFTKWQHPAMSHIALESWHWIRQVAAPCSVSGGSGVTCIELAQTSAILEFYIWFRFRLHHRSQHVILHQSPKCYPNRTTLGRKNDVIVDFQDGRCHPSWNLSIQ